MRFWILFITIFFSLSSLAQSRGNLKGTLQDSLTGDPVIGAVIEAASVTDSLYKKHEVSALDGKFSFSGLNYGTYNLAVSFLGYETLLKNIEINNRNLDLGTLMMHEVALQIEDIVIEVQAMRTSAKGDTVVYNADAFKVGNDAVAEDLLTKMPGIRIVDGQVEAHGEAVQKILVDGKEFFGGDVTTALKNLPAEMIDNIEVFNKLSDQAEFSGVDDGEGYKAINIKTRNNMNRGAFGKFYGGYGFNKKYNVGMSLNLFNDKRRFSIIGMANNINEQNFSSEDILGVMGASTGGGGGQNRRGGSGTSNFMVPNTGGSSKVYSLGLNYAEEWSEKVKFEGSYFFNATDNYTRTLTERNYYLSADSTQYYNAESRRNSTNYNHRINARLDYRIDDNNNIMWRPNLSFQSNDARNSSHSSTTLSSTDLENALVNLFESASRSDNTGYNISNFLLYMHKFDGPRPGRVLTASLGTNFSKNNNDQLDYSLTRYYNPDTTSELDQRIDNRSTGYRVNGGLHYAEPVSERSQILLAYRASYNNNDRDKRSYLLPSEEFMDSLSNSYVSGYLTQSVGPGYRYNKDKTMFVANVFFQHSALTGDQRYPTIANPKTTAYFKNVTYMAIFNIQINPTNTLRTSLRSNTNNPSITQLQDVLDVSNPLFISQGNPDLKPVYTHRLHMNYVRANIEKGRTFIVSLGGTTQSNYIANAVQLSERNNYAVTDEKGQTIVTLNQGAQYSKPVNLNGYWSVNGSISYGAPVKFIRSNLNIGGEINYSALPGIFNNINNTTNTTSYIASATLGSNISENVDFTFDYKMGYNVADNAQRPQSNNEYINHFVSGRLKLVGWWGLTLTSNGSYRKYSGITDSFSEEYFILNAAIGKKFLQGQRAEISVAVNDILDQNKSFTRSVTSSYIENLTTNVIGRFVSVNFVYNLRRFGGKTVDAMPSRGGGRPDGPPGEGRRPSGPPPGAMR